MIYLRAKIFIVRRINLSTLKDVAQRANVHPATVSRALNNVSYVKPETKARIIAAAAELNYHADVFARSFKKGIRYTIGVVVPNVHMTIFDDVIQCIETKARALGYYILFCHTNDDPEIEAQCLNRLRAGFVDGIIIASTGQNNALLREIHLQGIAIVQIVRNHDEKLSSVVSDYEEACYKAVHYLYDKGCREIALINGPSLGRFAIKPYKTRYEGYKRAVNELGLRAICEFTDGVINSFASGVSCAKKLLDENPGTDAIMTAVDVYGMAALRLLRERNIKVPDKIKVVSLTGYSVGNLLERSLTSFELSAKEIGDSATQIVIEEIEAKADNKPLVRHLTFAATLSERESS